ncbi:MAG: class I SAM-dependent methyltransferase, partial [Chryseolinea sp.]
YAEFEEKYLSLRSAEGRNYSDTFINNLPVVPREHPRKKEWTVRSNTLKYLKQFISKECKKTHFVLEVGCGNGWLSHNLGELPKTEVCCIDINRPELVQGARIFESDRNVSFIHGDIFTLNLETVQFSAIILAGSIQYFPDVSAILHRLLQLLTPGGKIHIVDSPIYSSEEDALAAKQRSAHHFEESGDGVMNQYYFHHQFKHFKEFDWQLLYDPHSWIAKVERLFMPGAMRIFPWIVIHH